MKIMKAEYKNNYVENKSKKYFYLKIHIYKYKTNYIVQAIH